MDIGDNLFSLGMIMMLVIAIAIIFVLRAYLRASEELKKTPEGKREKKITKFLDEGEDKRDCEICYGKIEWNPVAVCECKKVFHDACARPTGSCPYCNKPYATMTVRAPERTRCPVCGDFLSSNICKCGAVIPKKDGSFLCKCGGSVDRDKPVCRKCGAVYNNAIMQALKEQK
jgi:hypothetical protein